MKKSLIVTLLATLPFGIGFAGISSFYEQISLQDDLNVPRLSFNATASVADEEKGKISGVKLSTDDIIGDIVGCLTAAGTSAGFSEQFIERITNEKFKPNQASVVVSQDGRFWLFVKKKGSDFPPYLVELDKFSLSADEGTIQEAVKESNKFLNITTALNVIISFNGDLYQADVMGLQSAKAKEEIESGDISGINAKTKGNGNVNVSEVGEFPHEAQVNISGNQKIDADETVVYVID